MPSAIVERTVRRRSSPRRSDACARTPARRSHARRSRPRSGLPFGHAPRYRADRRIDERRDELAQRVGREHLPRVGVHDDVVARGGDAGVQRERLAAGRHLDDVHRAAIARERRHRVVGRSIGDDDDLLLVGGVVEAQEVVDARSQPRGFIARGDDDGNPVLRIADCGLRIYCGLRICGLRIYCELWIGESAIQSAIRIPQSEIQSAIRNPQSAIRPP